MSHPHNLTSRRIRRVIGAALALSLLLSFLPAARASAAAKGREVSGEALGALPLSFVPNAGQFGGEVRFHARGLQGTALFRSDGIDFALPPPLSAYRPRRKGERRRPELLRLGLRFEGAKKEAAIEADGALPGTVNYFIGSDPRRWRASVPTYGRIVYRGLYEGIRLRYDGDEGKLKSTYTVAAGADPARIRWRYEGASEVLVDSSTGDLRVRLPAEPGAATAGKDSQATAVNNNASPAAVPPAEVRERAPVAWQERDGRRFAVEVRYAVAADGSVGFALGKYDRALPLVIDPTYEFSHVLGGQGRDYGYAVALDRAGNIYLTGVTSSVSFTPGLPSVTAQPFFGGKTDVFVVKLNPAGDTVLYSTYLGGADDDWGFGVAVDAAGRAHVTGYTRSDNFPTASALQTAFGGGPVDAFAAKLSADGRALLYSTYLGGADEEVGHSVVVTPDGAAAVAGYTRSANFPVANALQPDNAGLEDAFVLKLSPGGAALVYGTYLGGAGDDRGQAVAADGEGNLYVAGHTASADFPVAKALQPAHAGQEDAFVLKLRPDGGAPAFSTFLGGADSDLARAVAVDRWGQVYVTGSTRSANFPVANALQPSNAGGDDAFVTKLNRKGQKLNYSTYLGGAGDDYGLGVAVDRGGLASVTGRTKSNDFPLAGAFRTTPAGGEEAFAARLSAGGAALDFSTFVGGLRREIGEGVATDAAGNVYVTGYTFSEDFPNSNAEPHRLVTDDDAFVMKLAAPTPAAAPCAQTHNVAASAAGATALASSVYPNWDFNVMSAIDGDRTGAGWGAGGGWNDATRDAYPDWLEVAFDDVKNISQVRVYTLRDDFNIPVEPTPDVTALVYGLINFEVQFWDGARWQTVPGGQVRANDRALRVLSFDPVTTDRVRLVATNSRANFSRVVELEAVGCAAP
ncbi:MAG TPA: SBBP repeat-containing protein [Pyrinomonadaceae bacterium]|nr:SBBP repeat-containing protein [Pyrinomonadaceae bacterium]